MILPSAVLLFVPGTYFPSSLINQSLNQCCHALSQELLISHP
jgi:hypothetical protein